MCPISDSENIRLIVIIYSILLFGISGISLPPCSWFVSMLSCGASLFGFGRQWLRKRWHSVAHGSSRCFTKVQRTGRWWRWITTRSEGTHKLCWWPWKMNWCRILLETRWSPHSNTIRGTNRSMGCSMATPFHHGCHLLCRDGCMMPQLHWKRPWCDVISSKIWGVMPLLWGKFWFYANRDDIKPVITILHSYAVDVHMNESSLRNC